MGRAVLQWSPTQCKTSMQNRDKRTVVAHPVQNIYVDGQSPLDLVVPASCHPTVRDDGVVGVMDGVCTYRRLRPPFFPPIMFFSFWRKQAGASRTAVRAWDVHIRGACTDGKNGEPSWIPDTAWPRGASLPRGPPTPPYSRAGG